MISRITRSITPEIDPEAGFSKNFQNRLILPLGSQEINFTVPPSLSPLSPRRAMGDFLSPMLFRRGPQEPAVSPTSPRRGVPDWSLLPPMTSRRRASEAATLKSPNTADGRPVRATTPSPVPGKLNFSAYGIPGASSLGGFNPELYKNEIFYDDPSDYPEDHLGRVWFTVEYEETSEKLIVTIIKAKNLLKRTKSSSSICNPLVRLYLLPDERRFLGSKLHKKTCNPNFEEKFGFQITANELAERTLKLTVYDVITTTKHHVIGHALFLLRDLKPPYKDKTVQKRDLTKVVTVSPLEVGELKVSLCYNDNLQRLTVNVGDTRNIKVPDRSKDPMVEYQARVSLIQQAKCVKVKKTSIVKTDESPCFNESFQFKITPDQLDISAISIDVKMKKQSDPALGRVLIGPFMFARGKANDHWVQMLGQKREIVQMWHSIS